MRSWRRCWQGVGEARRTFSSSGRMVVKMPLAKGSSKKVVQQNTEELIHTGRPAKQAYAIAMRTAAKPKGRPMKGKKT